jgi:hypothetical protein
MHCKQRKSTNDADDNFHQIIRYYSPAIGMDWIW